MAKQPRDTVRCGDCGKLVNLWKLQDATLTVGHKKKGGQYCAGGYLPVQEERLCLQPK